MITSVAAGDADPGAFNLMRARAAPDLQGRFGDANHRGDRDGVGAVWVFSAKGEPMYRIDSPEGLFTTNCAYGGKDGKQLFITESKSGTVLVADLNVPGRPMYSHA